MLKLKYKIFFPLYISLNAVAAPTSEVTAAPSAFQHISGSYKDKIEAKKNITCKIKKLKKIKNQEGQGAGKKQIHSQ